MEIHARNPKRNTLRAELIGSTCTAAGITARGYTPLLELCRKLVAAGHHPATPLTAWRGYTRCLFVHAIGEAAGLAVEDNKSGRPALRRWRDRPARGGTARPMRLSDRGAT